MGNSSSQNYAEGSRSVEIASRRRRMVEQVERFVVNVYASCSRVEAMWLILSSKLGQKAFETFVRMEESDALLSIFLATSDILSSADITWQAALSHLQLLQPQLTDPDSPVADLLPELFRNEFLEDFATMDGAGEVKLLTALLQRLQNELVLIMARNLFNRFIMSKHYKTWRAAEASHAIATTVEDASQSAESVCRSQSQSSLTRKSQGNNQVNIVGTTAKTRSNSRNANSRSSILRRSLSRLAVTRMSQGAMLRFRMRSVVAPQDLSTSAFSQMKGDELQALLRRRENWLASLVAAVEGLPVAFCLASCARPSRPLIFVNRFFEKSTGFNRDDLLGRSLGDVLLLHTSGALHQHSNDNTKTDNKSGDDTKTNNHTDTNNKSESEDRRAKQLREALQQCRGCVTVLDNKAADGRDFKCLSVLKPIYAVDVEEHRLFCGSDNNLNFALLNNNANNLGSNINNTSLDPHNHTSNSNGSSLGTNGSLPALYFLALVFDVSREVDNYVSKSALAADLMALLPDVLLHSEDDDEEDDLDRDFSSSHTRNTNNNSAKSANDKHSNCCLLC